MTSKNNCFSYYFKVYLTSSIEENYIFSCNFQSCDEFLQKTIEFINLNEVDCFIFFLL